MCERTKNAIFALLAVLIFVRAPDALAQTASGAATDVNSQGQGSSSAEKPPKIDAGKLKPAPSEIKISPITLHLIPCGNHKWAKWAKCTYLNKPISRRIFIEGSSRLPVTISAQPLASTDEIFHRYLPKLTFSTTAFIIDPINGTGIDATFELNKVTSGSYAGALTVVHNNTRTVVPVSVKISSTLEPVLFILLTGLIVSLGVTAYVVKRRDLDHIKINAFRIEDSINRDQTIHTVFRNRIQSDLDRVHASVKREDPTQAATTLESATKCLEKWRKHNAGWQHHLNNLDSLLQKIGAIKQKNNSLSSLENQLQAIEISAVDLDDPSKLENILEEPIEIYLKADQVVTSINRLAHLIQRLNPELNDATKSKYLSGFDHYKDRFRHFDLDDDQKVQELCAEINTTVDEIRGQAEQLLTPEPIASAKSFGQIITNVVGEWLERGAATQIKGSLRKLSGNIFPISFVSSIEVIGEIDFDRFFTKLRRVTFAIVGYVVLMIILVGSGLDQLYLSNPTFGANVWSDYISLFAWGFGAEAARSSIFRLAGSWQVPGLRQLPTGT